MTPSIPSILESTRGTNACPIMEVSVPDSVTDETIMVCPCPVAETHFRLFMQRGCEQHRIVIVGSRIKPDYARGAPFPRSVCIQPNLPKTLTCKYLESPSLMMEAYAEMKRDQEYARCRRELLEMDRAVLKLRAEMGLSTDDDYE